MASLSNINPFLMLEYGMILFPPGPLIIFFLLLMFYDHCQCQQSRMRSNPQELYNHSIFYPSLPQHAHFCPEHQMVRDSTLMEKQVQNKFTVFFEGVFPLSGGIVNAHFITLISVFFLKKSICTFSKRVLEYESEGFFLGCSLFLEDFFSRHRM